MRSIDLSQSAICDPPDPPTCDSPLWFKGVISWFQTGPISFFVNSMTADLCSSSALMIVISFD